MEKVKLGDVCEIINGYAFKSNLYEENGIRIIRITNVQKGYIEDTEPKFYNLNLKRELNKYMLYEKDLLISLTGNVGRVGILKKEMLPAALNQRVGCIRVLNKSRLDKNYLFNVLNNKLFENECINNSKGIAQKNLSTEWLKEYKINLPSLEEQKNIANKLDKVQKIIDIRKKQIEELEELIKSQFVEMFGTIKNSKFNIKTFEEFVKDEKNSIKRGPFGGSLKKEDFVEKGYLVYEQRHAIHNDFEYEKYYISEQKYKEMKMFEVKPGDLLISCSGVTLGRISEVPMNAKKGIINQALLKVTLNPSLMNNIFFIYQFRNDEIQEKLFSFSRGSGIPNFPSMTEVKKIGFICPPIELQNQFAEFVKQIDKQKFEIQKSLEETQKLQESLMNKYFK